MPTATITAVFANYREVVTSLSGQEREVSRTAFRGQEVDLPQREFDRLKALGAIESDQSTAQAVIARALNPLDVVPAPTAEPVVVSPPPLGAAPAGDASLVEGDQGTADLQPPTTVAGDAGAGITTTATGYSAEGRSVTEVADWLRTESPNAPATVAAAGGDAETAETVLEAERLVRDGDPRSTVEQPLQRIIDAGE